MIFTIVSPDKVTLSMFYDFYKTLYDSKVRVLDINCLYSSDIINDAFNTLKSESKAGNDFFVKFKVKVNLKSVPPIVIDLSDIVLSFDVYSMEPQIIKSNEEKTSAIIDRWKFNIDKFNKQ
jgi:hypothetical protein